MSTDALEGLGPLNLSDADLKGFEAVDAGRYGAEVFKIEMDAVKNTSGTGKLPAGTPTIKIQWRLLHDVANNIDGIENKRAFQNLIIPPSDYEAKKAAFMKGMMVRFFIAMGHTEEEVVQKKFAPQWNEYVGRKAAITLGKEPKKDSAGNVIPDEFNNPVKGVKPYETLAVSGETGGGIL